MSKRQASSPLECTCGRDSNLPDQGKPCEYCRGKAKITLKDNKDLPKQLDRLEALVERLCDGVNLDGAYDDDDDGCANDLDPEFGVKRIRLNPMDDAVYSSHISRENITPKFGELMGRILSKDLIAAYRESVANICLELTQLGFNLYPLDEYEHPKVDTAKYMEIVRSIVVDRYDMLEPVAKRVIRKGEFETLSPKHDHPTSALYYGTICCILAKFFDPGNQWNEHELQQAIKWAVINCARKCIRDSLQPASIDRLRAIVLLFMSGSELWIGGDTQNTLSRIAMSLCSDLGINREQVYVNLSSEERGEWASLFWLSYFINRSLSIRWGWFTSTEASYVSAGVVELAQSTQIFSVRPAIDLFRIYDSMYEFLSSGSAEVRSVRQLVRKSLHYLKELEDWWKRMFPTVPMAANPRLAVEHTDDTFHGDRSMRATTRMTICTFIYMRMSIYQCCTTTSASIKDHIAAMYPAEVAALREAGGVPASGLQNRIASLMSPAHSLRRVALQALQICTANMSYRDTCTKNLLDALNFSGAMLTAVLITRNCTEEELQAARDLSKAAEKVFKESNLLLLKDLFRYIQLHAELIAGLVTKFKQTPGHTPLTPESTKMGTTPVFVDSHLSNSDLIPNQAECDEVFQFNYNDNTSDLGDVASVMYPNQDMYVDDGLQLKTFVDRGLTEFLL